MEKFTELPYLGKYRETEKKKKVGEGGERERHVSTSAAENISCQMTIKCDFRFSLQLCHKKKKKVKSASRRGKKKGKLVSSVDCLRSLAGCIPERMG